MLRFAFVRYVDRVEILFFTGSIMFHVEQFEDVYCVDYFEKNRFKKTFKRILSGCSRMVLTRESHLELSSLCSKMTVNEHCAFVNWLDKSGVDIQLYKK